MAVRHTIERILRDDDDDSGQTIREWKIEAEPGVGVMVKMNHGNGFILLRADDVGLFVNDLMSAKDIACRPSGEERK